MNRNFGIGILTLCFGLSSVSASLAVQAVAISPVVVQPYDLQELNQQMLDRDRQNRDQEIAIQGLIEENNKLTQSTLVRQEDEGLKQINQTMLSYRNALLSRDQARIIANSERWPSRYGDLIALTEDVDGTTGVRGDLESKSGLLAQKYQMLTELKDEMTALNEKLSGGSADKLNQKEAIIEGYKKIAQEQQNKIQMLVGRLDEMDRKISRFDEIIAQKDRQIAHLKDNLARAQSEASSKDESIRWLNQVLAVTKNKAEYYKLTSQLDRITVRQLSQLDQITVRQLSQKQTQVDLLKSELENKINELYQKEQQVELLNTELQNKVAQEKNQSVLEYQIQDLKAQLQDKENQITAMKTEIQSGQKTQAQADTLRQQLADQQNKVDLLKQELDSKIAQSDQMTLMISDYQKKLESKNNAYNEELRQALLSKNDQARMEGQIADLSARLQEKEAQVVKIKKDMYDLQELTVAKDRETQAKDLSLSMMQRGMPSRDEIDFLRTGLKVAALQLKQKDEMLLQIKANADEYAKEFKEQSREFQSLKVQLQNAYEEIIRLKERSTKSTPHENNDALSKGDRLREKLKQALDEINEQGRVVNVLVQKLHEAGQSVDLTRHFAK